VVIAEDLCPFTIECLLALADLIGRLRSLPTGDAVVKDLVMVARRRLPRWDGTCGPSVPLAGTLRHRRRLQVRVPLGFACLNEGCLC
jgi:hypothetical protein